MTKTTGETRTTPMGIEGLIAPDASHPNCYGNVSEYRWTDAFYNKDMEAFKDIFHPEVTQSASTSPYINFGRKEVSETFAWASKFYKRCDFTAQASANFVEFLEFDLTTANDMHMTGMTALTKNHEGKVIKVFNGHRNLTETVLFSEHFVKGPKGKGTVSLFHKKALKKYGLEHAYPRNPAGFNPTAEVAESEYIDAFRDGSCGAFASICDDDVLLSSSYVSQTIEGIDEVSSTMALVSNFYEHCVFTSYAEHENRSYLLYKGRLRNGMIVSDGFLILVRNSEGKITEILDNPIPMHAGTLISEYLAKHYPDRALAEQYFYNESLFQKAVERYSLENVYGEKTRDISSFIKSFVAQFLIQV